MEKHYERIYEDFKEEFPQLADKVVDTRPRGAYSISMRMNDDSVINYNPVTHMTYIDNPDDAINISEISCINTFGEKLTNMMKQRGLTTNDVAYRTGLSATTINNYKRGKNAASWPAIVKLSQALSCEIDEFR